MVGNWGILTAHGRCARLDSSPADKLQIKVTERVYTKPDQLNGFILRCKHFLCHRGDWEGVPLRRRPAMGRVLWGEVPDGSIRGRRSAFGQRLQNIDVQGLCTLIGPVATRMMQVSAVSPLVVGPISKPTLAFLRPSYIS